MNKITKVKKRLALIKKHLLYGTSAYNKYFNQYQFIFIHIPKTGGLSILNSLFNKDFRVGHKSAMHYLHEDQEKFHQYFKFAFVRNPMDRFFSAYSFLEKGGIIEEDQEFAKEHILPYENFQAFVNALNDPSKVEQLLQWRHFKPQYKFVCNKQNKILVDFIGRYENIQKDYEHIRNKLGFGYDLKHINTSKKPDFRKCYDENMEKTVKNIYQQDFELFNYD